MPETFVIRPYRPEDLPRIAALNNRVQPYRHGDQVEIKAMFVRALRAREAKDPRWMDFPTYPEQTMEEEYEAFWVAEWQGQSTQALIGMVGVQAFRPGYEIAAHHPLVEVWQKRGCVAELRSLRVAPEARGQGIGTQLCQKVFAWALPRTTTLVVNTTTPQKFALRLYRKLGFRDAGLSFIDRYELVWLEK